MPFLRILHHLSLSGQAEWPASPDSRYLYTILWPSVIDVFVRFFKAIADECQEAGLVILVKEPSCTEETNCRAKQIALKMNAI
jgi:hypothetical protein